MATKPHHRRIKMEILPDILYSNILPRLPAESIHRFRYVCKQWHSFLTSPEFIKSHTHNVTTGHHQTHHKLLVLSTTTPCKFYTIDCQSPENGLSPRRPFPFDVSPKNIRILTTLNGLVCVGITNNYYDHYYSDMILWNPVTGDYKELSKSNPHEVNTRAYGLYYSRSDDDYKLLCVTQKHDAYVYSLRSNSSMELDYRNGLIEISRLVTESWGQSIQVNENLFFLKKGKQNDTRGVMMYSIVRFDTKKKRFTEIATPNLGTEVGLNFKLLQKDGRIHLCVIFEVNSVEFGARLWRMDDDRDVDWMDVVSYPFLRSLYCFQEPVCIMKNGNWLTTCLHTGCHVHKVDHVKDSNVLAYSNTTDSMDIVPTGIYIETLVSPNYSVK